MKAARQAWNLAVDQHPAAVAIPRTVEGVAAAIRYARVHGLTVSVQGTGHNAGSRATLRNSLLLRTSSPTGVEIDAEAGRVRVAAGVLWGDVATPASELGLVALAGSSTDVGVVGYSLGGGIGWLARKYGLAANSILAAEIITAEGLHLRVDADHEPDLYWALRGGAGAPGVVTARTLALPRLRRHPGRHDVALGARLRGPAPWREWSRRRRTRSPPCGGSHLRHGTAGRARVPAHGSAGPGLGEHLLLSELPAEAIDAFVEVGGATSGSPLVSVELRQLGGALDRDPVASGALGHIDAAFALFGVGIPMNADMAAAVAAHLRVVTDRLEPWSEGRSYLNFAERPTDTRTAFSLETYARLAEVKAQYDPDDLFRPGHRVPMA